ncbi:MAG TPA: nuclear transport factor 2 family protein [Pyrinomonadaceae bacterium]|nr:nuclear transport factor 2 family protein [Pyrinomonadaceae bacterium]
MKRCPTCNRTYTDPNLSFCTDDGTPLTPVDSPDETTVVSPRDSGAGSNWNEGNYRPPTAYVPPQARRRRVWPWVVGVGGVFVLAMLGIAIAVYSLIPRRVTVRTDPPPVVGPGNTNSNESANSNSNSNVNIEVPPPTDDDEVMAQLRDLEDDWTLANINDDKQALDRILADDYVGQTPEGELYSKAEYIRANQRDLRVEKWDFDDLKLNVIGDRATLAGKIKYVMKDEDDPKFEFLDKFVWRDGRWQATGSVTKRIE